MFYKHRFEVFGNQMNMNISVLKKKYIMLNLQIYKNCEFAEGLNTIIFMKFTVLLKIKNTHSSYI